MKNPLLSTRTAVLIACMLSAIIAKAQFPYSESFQNTSAPGMVIAGSAKLTAATGVDPVGQGYLRLTDNSTANVGYAYCNQAFPSNYGLTTSFEFYMWKSDALGYNQADGISFFLFDASVNSFRPGGTGGSLGYAQYYATPGMAKGYMGISIDGFGNFSSPTDGSKNGGPGQKRGSIAIRGPGDGKSTTDYVYQTGVVASDAPYNAGFLGFTQRYPSSSSPNYRKLQVILTPGSSLGVAGFRITVIMIKGGTPTTAVTLINNQDYPFVAPAQLKFGLSASTGSLSNYQEIRNLSMDVTNTGALLTPLLTADAAIVCQGQPAIMDVTANDVSANLGGSINKATVDLDPLTAGRQSSYTDAGKGSYSVDANGVVTFTPVAGYSGISLISYKVDDTYGITSLLSGAITVTVSPSAAPTLSLTNPAAVCAPASVNITNAAYKIATSIGASYDYFNSLSNANSNTGNINASANAITQSGTYYIRASLLGCATVKPIVVQVSSSPTASNGGSNQTFCSSTGSQSTTLVANNPDIGIGTWTQVSGPSTANINYTLAATTPITNMDKGVYIFRWTTSNGVCAASSSDVQVTVGVAANAGSAQSFANANSTTLAGNAASPGTGTWTQLSGPAITITNPANPASTITGLVPGNTYQMQWKVVNGACTNTSQVTITNVLNTIANAGLDRLVAEVNQVTLAGNSPDAGNTGTWTILNGPAGNTATIAQPNNPTAIISNINRIGTYTLRWTMANGSFSNSDDMLINVTVVLPVKLLSFNGQLQDNTVLLKWTTADEANNDHFDVLRSTDGINFSSVGIVPITRAGIQHNYSFTDQHPVAGRTYYRLKTVALNGTVEYSRVINIDINNNKDRGIAVYPNPVNDYVQLSVRDMPAGQYTLSFLNANGQKIHSSLVSINSSYQVISFSREPAWKTGVYLLQLSNGNEGYATRVVLK